MNQWEQGSRCGTTCLWRRADLGLTARAGTKNSQVGEMWLCSPLSLLPEWPPSTSGIHSLTQQRVIKHLPCIKYPKRHWGYSSKQSNTNPPQWGLHSRGFHPVAWGCLLGCLEISVRVSVPFRFLFTRTRKHTHGHNRLICIHRPSPGFRKH